MMILEKLRQQNKQQWDKLTDAQKEQQIAEAIIDLAYDTKMSIKSMTNVQRLLFRLDEYEATIAGKDGVK